MSRWRRGKGDEPSGGADDGDVTDDSDGAPAHEVSRPGLSLPFPPLLDLAAGFSLRPWGTAAADPAALATAWVDPEIARWTRPPERRDVAAAEHWISGEEARRERGLALDLVIASAQDPDQVLGEVGLAVVEQERRWAELGYWLTPRARGKGLASTSVRCFAGWALRDLPINRLFARTHPDNPAAGAVAERAGFERAGALDDGTEVWSLGT